MSAALADVCGLCVGMLSVAFLIAIGSVIVALITADRHRGG
jgi:hypothetical protein